MADIEQEPILKVWAEDTTYYNEPSQTEIGAADDILPNYSIDAEPVNGALRIVYLAIQFLQRTGGLYKSTIPYIAGQSCSLVRKINSEFRISTFICKATSEITATPPLTGATIVTTNGVDVYTDGTVDTTNWEENFPDVLGFGENSFTDLSSADVYDSLTKSGDLATFDTTCTNTPDNSYSWAIQCFIYNSSASAKLFIAMRSASDGFYTGYGSDDITWSKHYTSTSVRTNIYNLMTNVVGLGANTFTGLSSVDVYETLLYSGDRAVFDTSCTNIPNTDNGWAITLIFVNNTTKFLFAISSAGGFYYGVGVTGGTITWYNCITDFNIGSDWSTALAEDLGNYIPCKEMTNSHVDSTAPYLLLYKEPYEGSDYADYGECRGVINLKRGSASSYLIDTSIKLNICTGYNKNYSSWNSIALYPGGNLNFNVGICTYNSERWICLSGTNTPGAITNAYFSGWCSESTGPILVSSSEISNFTQDTYITKQNQYHNNGLIIDENVLALGQSTILQEDDYYVINSDSTFQTLCNATSGTYHKVKVLEGDWTSTSPLDLSVTGIEEITGNIGSHLIFDLTGDAYGITGAGTEKIEGLEISFTSTVTGSCLISLGSIINCTLNIDATNAFVRGINTASKIENVSFVIENGTNGINLIYSSENIENIIVSADSAVSFSSSSSFFQACNHMHNINVSFSNGLSGTINLFYNCLYVSKVYSNIVSNSSDDIFYFSNYYGDLFSDIRCIFSGAGLFKGFYTVNEINNVELTISTTNVDNSLYHVLFNNCDNLSNISINISGDITSNPFLTCDNITGVKITDTTTGNNSTTALKYIFESCNNISDVVISEFTLYDDDASIFDNCENINNIKITASNSTGDTFACFEECYRVSNVEMNITTSSNTTAYAFDNTLYISNSAFLISATSATGIYGLVDCDYIDNIHMTLSGSASLLYGLLNCDIISKMRMNLTNSTSYVRAIYGCSQISNFKISGTAATGILGLYNCDEASNGDITISGVGNSYNIYGCHSCTLLNNIRTDLSGTDLTLTTFIGFLDCDGIIACYNSMNDTAYRGFSGCNAMSHNYTDGIIYTCYAGWYVTQVQGNSSVYGFNRGASYA